MQVRWIGMVLGVAVACGPAPGTGSAGGSGATEAKGTTTTGEPPTGGAATTGGPDPGTTTGTTTTGTTTTGAASTSSTGGSSSSTGGPALQPCDGKHYECSDGLDNDGDGAIDLADLECTSVCDDDEATFRIRLPSGDADCQGDCYFDDNTGVGDDGCYLDLECDPLGPGEPMQCIFNDGPACADNPEIPPECVTACLPITPNGCDCFGCCRFAGDGGPIDVYLDSPGCKVDDLAACAGCTFHDACANPCDEAACEVCIGVAGPPAGCDAPGCVDGVACTVDEQGLSSCGPGMYCVTGCCAPVPG